MLPSNERRLPLENPNKPELLSPLYQKIAFLVVIGLVVWAFVYLSNSEKSGAKSNSPNALNLVPLEAKVKPPCEDDKAERLDKAGVFLKQNNPDAAFDLLQPCRTLFTPLERDVYIKALTMANAKRAKIADQAAKAARLFKKQQGVNIGASQQDALDSSWGKPKRVNRTTRADGVTEQWVYDGGYLYFENGILRAIQN
jgi:hypothetical protein